MTCSTPGFDDQMLDTYGIIPGNVYTLIAARQEIDKNGNPVFLVKIRNPWNEGEWKGKWCDGSEEWYD